MIKFTTKFPFIKFIKQLTAEDYYEAVTLDSNVVSEHNYILVKKCRDLLLENRIPLQKIRLVTDTTIIYDVDKNVINPTYNMLPKEH